MFRTRVIDVSPPVVGAGHVRSLRDVEMPPIS